MRSNSTAAAKRQIGDHLRRLRVDRGWSQVTLAQRLRLSQSRLSGIEHGRQSLTAEQFLDALKLFNVPATDFVSQPRSSGSQLQNALERLGATHLRERPDLLPSDVVKEAGDVIREVLIAAESPRHLTALGPVIVRHADEINFDRLRTQLHELGLRRRLGWLVENTLAATLHELETPLPLQWRSLYRRAIVVLEDAVPFLGKSPRRSSTALPDILDRTVRSSKTAEQLARDGSAISRQWNVVTAIQIADFVAALRASRGRN